MAVNSDHVPNGLGLGHTGQLCRELELTGVELLSTLDGNGALASGVALQANARDTLASDGAAAQFRQQAFDILASGMGLSVSVCETGEGTDANAAFSSVCELLRSAAVDAAVSPDRVEMVADAEAIAPQTAWLLRRERLGDGPVHLLPGLSAMQPGRLRRDSGPHELFWPQLWQAHTTGNVQAAFAPAVHSPCSLLSAEAATGVLPGTAVQVPPGTAWLPMRMDLSRFADGGGHLRLNAIEHAVCRSVEIGELLHDTVNWPTARMRHDAWLNRRLAIIVTGFGDLVRRRGQDPAVFASLEELSQLLRWVQDLLLRQSREVAQGVGNLPALELTDPSRTLPIGQVRNSWRTRWREASRLAAIRHRNLLVLSPWSVFPANEPADWRNADLLPLLGFGDACAFPRPPALSHWNVNQFKSFHQRAWAVLQQRDASRQIAERI